MKAVECAPSAQLDCGNSGVYKTEVGRRVSIPDAPPIDAASKRRNTRDPVLGALFSPVPTIDSFARYLS